MNALNQLLTPRVKRYGIVFGTALILMVLIFATSKRQTPNTGKTNGTSTSSVDFTGVPPKELTLNRISADLERIHQQQKALQEEHQQEVQRLQQEIHLLNRKEPVENKMPAITSPEPEPLPDVLNWNQYNQPPPVYNSEPDYYEAPPQPPRTIRMLGAVPPAVPSGTTPKDPPKLLRLPAGSLLSGQLITGLDVPTGQGARREPYPVLIRIKASAILPNRYRTNVRECFVLASGYGDLSSERAYFRSETLSCILKQNDKEQVIERPLEGYIAGEDGKAGLRGRLVSKQGQVMAKAAMAGFLSGISEAFDIKPLIMIALFIPLIQGCSTLGVGESDYACANPGKGVCKSARQVYKDTSTSTTDDFIPTSPPSVVSKADTDLSIVPPEAIPNRLPAQVLRIWIAPWVDKQGNWHSGGVVMTDIYPREWQSAVPIYSPSENE